jgi:prepilin-type N-terminal cleavage/methylation domain-containing protein
MTLGNIKKMKEERGFTIVELLIVIVVIAILAAIVIVAYNGVQNKANTTKAQTNAAAVQKVAEAYNADNSRYPGALSDFSAASTVKLPAGVTVVSGVGTAHGITDGKTQVSYQYKGSSATTATGGRIQFWDFTLTPAAVSATKIYVGDANGTDADSVFKQAS